MQHAQPTMRTLPSLEAAERRRTRGETCGPYQHPYAKHQFQPSDPRCLLHPVLKRNHADATHTTHTHTAQQHHGDRPPTSVAPRDERMRDPPAAASAAAAAAEVGPGVTTSSGWSEPEEC